MNTSGKHQNNGSGRPDNRHAVVLGGSLAGLLAARVLADHFAHVTLIERDAYPVLAFTRPLLDLHVRRRLSQNPRIEIMDNTEVLSLVADAPENRIAGVLVCDRQTELDRRVAKEIKADLVVETMGQASRGPAGEDYRYLQTGALTRFMHRRSIQF